MKVFIQILVYIFICSSITIGQISDSTATNLLTVDQYDLPQGYENLKIGFYEPKTKIDTIEIPCLCFIPEKDIRILSMAGSRSILIEKRLERNLEEIRVTTSEYPYSYQHQFFPKETRWLDDVEDCFILNSAQDYSD